MQVFGGDDGALREEGLHGEFAEERTRALRSDAAGDVAFCIGRASETEYPVAKIFGVGGILVGPVEADEESVPIPHLVVVAGGDEVGVLDVSVGGADGLRGEAIEVGGEVVEERLVGRRVGREGIGPKRE